MEKHLLRRVSLLTIALLATPVAAQDLQSAAPAPADAPLPGAVSPDTIAGAPAAAVSVDSGAGDAGVDEPIDTEGDEILVVATRLRGQVDAPQPPVMTLDEADIASYGSSSLSDLVAALAPQTGTGRGRGSGMPVFLLNGQRISNFREMRNIPPEAIRRLEVLPEEVALRFGYSPNQRVINFILKDNFSNRSVDAEYRTPSRGGFAEYELEGSLLKIDGASRLNLNVKATDSSMLTEAERGVIQQVPVAPGAPDPGAARSLVPDSRELSLTASWSRGLGKDGADGSLALNGQVSRDDSLSLSGLDNLVLATGDVRALARRTRTDTVQGGATLNKPLGAWQMTVTLDASRAQTDSTIDRLSPADPDRARSVDSSANLLATVVGRPFSLPAGDATATIKAGFAWDGIDSRDTRQIGETHLDRGDVYGGINIGLPIASRRDNVLAGIGDLSVNFSADVARQSDFGWLSDWSAGLTWSPLEGLGLQASYIVNQESPSLSQLGGPLLTTLNVPVYDFTRGESALVTVTSGGNRGLLRETQRDLKLSANWELPFLKNSNVIVEYFRNRSSNVTAAFPVLTPEIEAAFPGRAIRDASGKLIAIDRRPVTFDETQGSRLRYGFNVSGAIGKPPAGAEAGARMGPPRGGRGGAGGPGMGRMMGGPGGGAGRWNLSLYHTVRFSEQVIVSPTGPVLNLLEGDALTGGGVARHALELEGGAFYKGFGLRFNGSWTAPTKLRSTGAPASSDLRFGEVFDVDLRAFVNFDQQKSVVEAIPFLKGSRLALEVENVFDSRQRVTDSAGLVPLNYQADFLDPRGRVIGIDFRKTF